MITLWRHHTITAIYSQSNTESSTNKWSCRICQKSFKTRTLLRKHRRESHTGSLHKQFANYTYSKETELYTCRVCNMEFANRIRVRKHFLIHEEKFTCEVCGEVQDSAYRYASHLNEHVGDDKYSCPLCQYITKRKSSIAIHLNSVHLKRYPYYCKHCGKGYYDAVTYNDHEKMHLGNHSLICVVCQKEFNYTRNLIHHQIRSHKVSTIDLKLQNQCYICKKNYSSPYALQRHMQVHEGTTSEASPNLCEWCGKNFRYKCTLTTHIRIHTGYKPHKCSYCEKVFSAKKYLVLHERTHSGEKPYSCDHCGKRFNQPAPLKTHLRSHTGERPFNCHLCNKGFISKSALRTHIPSCSGCK